MNHFVIVGAPGTSVAGTPFTFTVIAENSHNVTITGYTGIAHFTSSDQGASTVLPADSGLTNGMGSFSATLTTAGSQTLTVADTVVTSATGTATILVTATNALHFVVTAPATATAGIGIPFTVMAEDQFNNVATTYGGNVAFSSSDHGAATVLPAASGLTNGVGTFNATLTTAETQTLTATDNVTSSITGASGPIVVSAASATHFVVTAPGTATAGVGVPFTVKAEDQFNNIATSYGGLVKFTTSDHGASTLVPGNSGLTNGVGTFNATLTTAGTQTLTATDTVAATLTGASGPIVVSAATATHFAVAAPGTATGFVGFNFTVTAEDQFNNVAITYGGLVTFSSSDHGGATVLPANSSLTNGMAVFSATLTTAGSQTLTATDTVTSSINGHSGPIVVSGVTLHFAVTAPATAVAGANTTFTVMAEDSSNTVFTGYSGVVTFTSSDNGASTVLPANSGLVNGVGTFSATLTTAGGQTLSATDTVNSGITGHATITISAASATHFVLNAPTAVAPSAGFTFTVTAEDKFNNVATGYGGQVNFTSSDGAATLPPNNSTLVAGAATFSATLVTGGSQILTATDTVTSSITGTATILVSTSAATHFVISAPANVTAGTAFTFTVTAEDNGNNTAATYSGIVTITSSDTGASTVLPASASLTNGVGTFTATLTTSGNQTLTAADTVNTNITAGIATVNVNAAAAARFVVTSQPTATAGVAFIEVVSAYDRFNNLATGYNGTVHFTSSDPQVSPGNGLPIDSPLFNLPTVSGVGYFAVVLKTAGIQTVTVTDDSAATLTGTSNQVTVVAGPPPSSS